MAAGRGAKFGKGSGVAAERGVERQWSKASAVVQSEKVRKAKSKVWVRAEVGEYQKSKVKIFCTSKMLKGYGGNH